MCVFFWLFGVELQIFANLHPANVDLKGKRLYSTEWHCAA